MQLRVPNQYKPTFLQNLLSGILPVPTRRVLSDKKIEKHKKINLSITDEKKNKSNKKITISSSLQKKETPSTNSRHDSKGKQVQSVRAGSGLQNRGLNFHPRKINFQQQQLPQTKIKSQLVLSPSEPVSSYHKTPQVLTINRTAQPRLNCQQLGTKDKLHVPLFFTDPHINHTSHSNHTNHTKIATQFHTASINTQINANSLPNSININNMNITEPGYLNLSTKYQHVNVNQNPQAKQNNNDSCQKRLYSPQKKVKQNQTNINNNKSNNNSKNINNVDSNSNKNSINQNDRNIKDNNITGNNKSAWLSKPTLFKNINVMELSLKNKNKNQLKNVEDSNNSNQDIQLVRKDLSKSQAKVETPKKSQRIDSKIKTQINQQCSKQKLKTQIFIIDLFSKANTIQSKYDEQQSNRSSSAFSNVIQKISGNRLKSMQGNQHQHQQQQYKYKQIMPRDWDDIRRKSITTKLYNKFIQNNQQMLRNRADVECMNFKKKKYGTETNQQYSERAQQKSLQYLQDIFINNKPLTQNYSHTPHHNSPINCLKTPIKPLYQQFIKINYLGVGRFASVYLCTSPRINFIFAIKQILKFTVMYNSLQKQVIKQIQIQYQCKDANIIQLYHAWSDQKKYYLALQYGQQNLLMKLQKYCTLTQKQSINCIFEIAKGLQYLHARGIAHRDIKPQNIMIVNGVCKIGDFGWASKMEPGVMNQACGTPCYISPQMENLEMYTAKTDCWSLGVLAYQLVKGKLDQSFFARGGLNRDNLYYRNTISTQYRQMVYKLLAKEQCDRLSISQLLALQIFKGK